MNNFLKHLFLIVLITPCNFSVEQNSYSMSKISIKKAIQTSILASLSTDLSARELSTTGLSMDINPSFKTPLFESFTESTIIHQDANVIFWDRNSSLFSDQNYQYVLNNLCSNKTNLTPEEFHILLESNDYCRESFQIKYNNDFFSIISNSHEQLKINLNLIDKVNNQILDYQGSITSKNNKVTIDFQDNYTPLNFSYNNQDISWNNNTIATSIENCQQPINIINEDNSISLCINEKEESIIINNNPQNALIINRNPWSKSVDYGIGLWQNQIHLLFKKNHLLTYINYNNFNKQNFDLYFQLSFFPANTFNHNPNDLSLLKICPKHHGFDHQFFIEQLINTNDCFEFIWRNNLNIYDKIQKLLLNPNNFSANSKENLLYFMVDNYGLSFLPKGSYSLDLFQLIFKTNPDDLFKLLDEFTLEKRNLLKSKINLQSSKRKLQVLDNLFINDNVYTNPITQLSYSPIALSLLVSNILFNVYTVSLLIMFSMLNFKILQNMSINNSNKSIEDFYKIIQFPLESMIKIERFFYTIILFSVFNTIPLGYQLGSDVIDKTMIFSETYLQWNIISNCVSLFSIFLLVGGGLFKRYSVAPNILLYNPESINNLLTEDNISQSLNKLNDNQNDKLSLLDLYSNNLGDIYIHTLSKIKDENNQAIANTIKEIDQKIEASVKEIISKFESKKEENFESEKEEFLTEFSNIIYVFFLVQTAQLIEKKEIYLNFFENTFNFQPGSYGNMLKVSINKLSNIISNKSFPNSSKLMELIKNTIYMPNLMGCKFMTGYFLCFTCVLIQLLFNIELLKK